MEVDILPESVSDYGLSIDGLDPRTKHRKRARCQTRPKPTSCTEETGCWTGKDPMRTEKLPAIVAPWLLGALYEHGLALSST